VRTFCGAILLTALAPAASAWAQAATIERTVNAQADKDVRVGIYVNVQPDCSSGPLPTIRLTDPPTNGRVVVKRVKIGATITINALPCRCPAWSRSIARGRISRAPIR
jgi:hypothetical protein